MNKVSESKLAIAVSKAGCLPSISFYNCIFKGKYDLDYMKKEIDSFFSECKGSLVLSIGLHNLETETVMDFVLKNKADVIEIIIEDAIVSTKKIDNWKLVERTERVLFPLKTVKKQLILKSISKELIELFENTVPHVFDAYVLKGPEGAGSVSTKTNLEKDLAYLVEKFKKIKLIPSGGIATAQKVVNLTKQGFDYVGVGTAFALSQESIIDIKTKERLLGKELGKFNDTGQNAIIFSLVDDFDKNHTAGLQEAIKGECKGHVFAGSGIGTINKIKPVTEIVKELVNGL